MVGPKKPRKSILQDPFQAYHSHADALARMGATTIIQIRERQALLKKKNKKKSN